MRRVSRNHSAEYGLTAYSALRVLARVHRKTWAMPTLPGYPAVFRSGRSPSHRHYRRRAGVRGLWGFWGVFFAIPLATVVQAVLKTWPRRDEKADAVPGSVS